MNPEPTQPSDKDQSQERVLIEDYHGPASTLPPIAPTNTQITAEAKQEPNTATIGPASALPASSAIDWPLDLAKLGALLGGGSVGGLIPSTGATLLLYGQYPNLPTPLHDAVHSWTGVLIASLAILGFILCIVALFLHHNSLEPRKVLFGSRIGLALSAIALIVVLFSYFYLP